MFWHPPLCVPALLHSTGWLSQCGKTYAFDRTAMLLGRPQNRVAERCPVGTMTKL